MFREWKKRSNRIEQGRWLFWFCRVLWFLMACGWLWGRPWGWGLDGKHPQQERNRNPLLERWLDEEGKGCSEEPAFLAWCVSAAAQLVPFLRSIWWNYSEVCYLLNSWVRAVTGNFSTAGNSGWLFHTHLSDTNSKPWVSQISQAVSSLLAEL